VRQFPPLATRHSAYPFCVDTPTRIAVALLTCDRYDYTERTVASFLAHNPFLDRFILLHGDDASTDERVVPYVQAAGFKTVWQPNKPRPVHLSARQIMERILKARAGLFDAAGKRADWILFLENDIETLRTFPWFLFDCIAENGRVECLRLYGENKSEPPTDENRCLAYNKITRRPVKWKKVKHAPEAAEMAHVHWSAQPSVTRSFQLRRLHHTGTDLQGFTVRVLENVTSHIGVLRTRELV
jgi:hypothetical protein